MKDFVAWQPSRRIVQSHFTENMTVYHFECEAIIAQEIDAMTRSSEVSPSVRLWDYKADGNDRWKTWHEMIY